MNETKIEQTQEQKTDTQSVPTEEAPKAPALRQVLIETDGNRIKISKNEAASPLELKAILSTILSNLQ
jgi:hypothetical protein